MKNSYINYESTTNENEYWRPLEVLDELQKQHHRVKVKHVKKRVTDYHKKQKLVKSLNSYSNSMCVGPYVREKPGGSYVKRCNRARTKFYKKVSNRKVRNSTELPIPRQKNYYRRCFDYHWEID